MLPAAVAGLLLLCGPVLAAPVAAGVWTWRALAGPDTALIAGAGAAVVVFGIELACLRRHGLVQQVGVLILSAFWAGWLYLGLSAHGYDWTAPPPLKTPDPAGWMLILAAMLAWLTLYGFAATRRINASARG